MADELPPLIAELIGDASELYSTLDDVEARLTAFARQDFTAALGLDVAPLLGKLQEAETALDLFSDERFDATLGLDTAEALAELAAFETMADAQTITLNVDLNMTAALAELAALKGAAGGIGVGGLAQAAAQNAAGGGGGGGGNFLGTALGSAAGGRGGGRLGGVLGLGTGVWPKIPIAGFGTLGSMAGLGGESILGLGAGVAGFAAHGALGGAALGLTSLGVTAAGMGTDMAGLGQAGGDIKQYGQLQANLKQTAAVYGKGSTEYAAAMYAYQQWSSTLSKGYIQAVATASGTATAFQAMFDKVTGAAATTGAQIINSAMKVGEKFLPTIGKFAAENMKIIQSSLQPLFTWLTGPGLTAFNQIEQVFTNHLPKAMHAFDQAVELVIRTIAHFAPQTGGLIGFLDKLFSKLNGSGFDKWIGEVQRAIDAFKTWEKFVKTVGDAIYELFHNDAGTGEAFIKTLTRLIGKFDQWAHTVAGGDKLHDYMEAHKQEVEQLVGLFGNLISIMGTVHLTVGPDLMEIVGDLLKFVNLLLGIPGVNKVLGFVIAFELLARHVSLLKPLVDGFNGAIKNLALNGIHLLGGALSDLGGPLGKLGNWLSGVGTNTPAAQMQQAAGQMSEAAASMQESAASMAESFAGIGTAAGGAATDVQVAAGKMDEAMVITADDAEVTAVKVDSALGSEGVVGDLSGGGLLAGGALAKGAGGDAAAAEEAGGLGAAAKAGGVGLLAVGGLLYAINKAKPKKSDRLDEYLTGGALPTATQHIASAIGWNSKEGWGSNLSSSLHGITNPVSHAWDSVFGGDGSSKSPAQGGPKPTTAQGALAKDSTLQKQINAIDVLKFNLAEIKNQDGTNSSQYKKALGALHTTEEKYLSKAGTHADLSGVNLKITGLKTTISDLKNSQHADQQNGNQQLSKAQDTLKAAKSQMMTLEQGKASKSAIDDAKKAVDTATGHVDQVKNIINAGNNVQATIKTDTGKLSKLEDIHTVLTHVNTDTTKLHTDLTPMTGGGINIAKLPTQAMTVRGKIQVSVN